GLMNYRGEHVQLLQENREVGVPVVLSSRGYGILWDNPAVTDVNFGTGGERIIPTAQLFDENGPAGGLTGRYFQGTNFDSPVATNVDAEVNFDWTQKAPAGLGHDHYSVRWDGFIEAKQAGNYEFAVTSDDGVRMWIDGNRVFNHWSSRSALTF